MGTLPAETGSGRQEKTWHLRLLHYLDTCFHHIKADWWRHEEQTWSNFWTEASLVLNETWMQQENHLHLDTKNPTRICWSSSVMLMFDRNIIMTLRRNQAEVQIQIFPFRTSKVSTFIWRRSQTSPGDLSWTARWTDRCVQLFLPHREFPRSSMWVEKENRSESIFSFISFQVGLFHCKSPEILWKPDFAHSVRNLHHQMMLY